MMWQPGTSLKKMVDDAVLAALHWHGGNRTHTAKALKIAVRTLTMRLKRLEAEGRKVPAPPRPGEQACAPDAHQWKTEKVGGGPTEAGSYEFVTFCNDCGMEHPGG